MWINVGIIIPDPEPTVWSIVLNLLAYLDVSSHVFRHWIFATNLLLHDGHFNISCSGKMRHMVPTNHHPNMFAWISNVGKIWQSNFICWPATVTVQDHMIYQDSCVRWDCRARFCDRMCCFGQNGITFSKRNPSVYYVHDFKLPKKNALLRHVSRLRLSPTSEF